jgi:hypothetical protein
MIAEVTRHGILMSHGRIEYSLRANDLTMVSVDGHGVLVANQSVREHPGIILHALTCLRHGLEFDPIRFIDAPRRAAYLRRYVPPDEGTATAAIRSHRQACLDAADDLGCEPDGIAAAVV